MIATENGRTFVVCDCCERKRLSLKSKQTGERLNPHDERVGLQPRATRWLVTPMLSLLDKSGE
jgi:hypothetical protein